MRSRAAVPEQDRPQNKFRLVGNLMSACFLLRTFMRPDSYILNVISCYFL